tara:strand:- start:170994 stop:172361 length:1368 start_codon:yes stop_codon:yes gene_type:complete
MTTVKNLRKRKIQLLKKRLQKIQESYNYYKPHAKQKAFHKAGKKHKERLFLAGNRCGKTYCGAMEMAMHLTGLYPDWWQGLRFDFPIKAWAASNTAESTRDILQRAYLGSSFDASLGSIPLHLVEKMTKKRGVTDAVDTLYIKHKSGGVSLLGFKSYDQGREKFQGTSRHFIHLDEEPEMRLYEECLMRTLDVEGSLILTMTPLKGMTDICQHYLQQEVKETTFVTTATWDDAFHLNDSEKEKLRKTLRPHELEAREKGVPSLGAGKVFPIKESDILVEPFAIPSHFSRCFGMDFGWTNPTAIVWGAKDLSTGILYIYEAYTASECTPAQHAKVIKEKGVKGVCDPAGLGGSQSDGVNLIQQYLEHGVSLTTADNNVEAGLMQVLDAMRTGKLKVFNHLESWLHEFRLYRRKEDGKIVKRYDHLMDATRYLVVSGIFSTGYEKRVKRAQTDWKTI